MVAEDDRPQVGLERLAGLEPRRLVGQPAFDVDKARRIEPADGRHRRLEMDVPEPAVADRARTRWTDAMLPTPPHWATSRPPGRSHRGEVREQGVVVGDPVEGRGRQDRVDRPFDRQRARRGRRRRTRPGRRTRQPLARGLDHRRRTVERDDPAARAAASASSSVTRPLPQPASRTRSSPSSGSRSSTTDPQRVIGAATRS